MRALFAVFTVAFAIVCSSNASADDGARWHVAMGATNYTIKCDEVGDIVFGDDNVPIYSCRIGQEWQAVKGNQKFMPKCDRMDHIWNGQSKSVMYTCTGRSIFVGNAPQVEGGPWKYELVNGYGRRCNGIIDYSWQCVWKLVNENHKSRDTYENVSPKRFPDSVDEIAFHWSPPAPPRPESSDSDVVVNEAPQGRQDSARLFPQENLGENMGCVINCGTRRVPNVPDGMPTADPTRIPDGQAAVVSCDNRAITRYLLAGTKPVWLMPDGGDKVRVCVDKTTGKPWDDTWDLVAYNDGTASYFGKLGSTWRLVKAGTEGPAFESIEWHGWFQQTGIDMRAYIAMGKSGDTKPTVHFMVDGQQVSQSVKSVTLVRFVGKAKSFAYAVQD